MHIVRWSTAALIAVSLGGCSATPETGQGAKENTGTLFGALTGGLIGSQFGGGTGERVAAGLVGAAVGGLIGNRIGAAMDDEDKRRADGGASAGPGERAHWSDGCLEKSGLLAGTARSSQEKAYESNGLQCRPYTHTIYIDGRPQVARGNACRNPDGTWTAVA